MLMPISPTERIETGSWADRWSRSGVMTLDSQRGSENARVLALAGPSNGQRGETATEEIVLIAKSSSFTNRGLERDHERGRETPRGARSIPDDGALERASTRRPGGSSCVASFAYVATVRWRNSSCSARSSNQRTCEVVAPGGR